MKKTTRREACCACGKITTDGRAHCRYRIARWRRQTGNTIQAVNRRTRRDRTR